MKSLSRNHFHTCLLALLLFCLCFLPTHTFIDEQSDPGATSKYVTSQHGSAHLANYRHQSLNKYIGHTVLFSRFISYPKLAAFASPPVIVTFLFLIQIRLKWQKLMPIKYESRFVVLSSRGTKTIPERGFTHDKIHTRRSQHDSPNRKGAQNFLDMHPGSFGRDVSRAVFFRLGASVPSDMGGTLFN
ncbi:UNVERIFIED_CONTAM: hypothetical protein ABID98_004299 [Brevibacillus sp. OAP136]